MFWTKVFEKFRVVQTFKIKKIKYVKKIRKIF